MILRSVVALVAALVAGNAWAAQAGLEPGSWKLKVASAVNGKPEPEHNTQDCLHADQLKDLGAYFAPDLEGVKAKCTKVQKPTGDATKLAYQMRCTGAGFTLEMDAGVSIENSRHFVADIRMHTKTRKESALVVAKAEGRWDGACKPESQKK
ncbi:MAG: DUF3617 family protein [Burkholderiales bacterium]